MGMFDHYEPDPVLHCPRCNAELSDWQGKDGPCFLLSWKQGEKYPVQNRMVGQERNGPAVRRPCTLPEFFDIHTSCRQCEQWVDAECRGENYVWIETIVLDAKCQQSGTDSLG